jgi:dipeptidyl aminopeptidase/acylaminoacyl peptidase
MRSIRHTLALALCLGLQACVSDPMAKHYAGPKAPPDELAQMLAYEKAKPLPDVKTLAKKDSYEVERIKLAVKDDDTAGEHEVVIDYYHVAGDKKRPIILVLPILGGGNDVAKYFASYFAGHGLAAAIVHRGAKDKDANSLDELNRTFRRIVLDHRRAIDWIESRPELDHDRVGVFGVSAGGIKGALVTALDQRVKAAVLCLAGGDLPYILVHSTERGIRKRRDKVLQEQHISADELYAALKAEFQYDPLNFAQYIDARKVLLILASFDEVVPIKTGELLRKAIGKPKTIYLPTGHYGAVLFAPWMRGEALAFLKDKLDWK